MRDIPAAESPEPRIGDVDSTRNQEAIPVATIEEDAEDKFEQEEIRGRGPTEPGRDN